MSPEQQDSFPSSTIHRAAAIPLPELLQALAHQRQDSLIEVELDEGRRLILVIDRGCVRAIHGFLAGDLVRFCAWSGLATREEIVVACGDEVLEITNYEAGKRLARSGLFDQKKIKTAIEGLIGETVCEIIASGEALWRNLDEILVDEWIRLLRKLSLQVPINPLLMEGARRLDEMQLLEDFLVKPWDLLQCDEAVLSERAGDLDQREQAVAQAYGHGLTRNEVVAETWMPDFHVQITAAGLLKQGVLRLVPPAELVVQADRFRQEGKPEKAEGLYRRSIARGTNVARVHYNLGELAEQRGNHKRAVEDFLLAAGKLEAANPDQAGQAYRAALRLGADRRHCLDRLLAINTEQGDEAGVVDLLFELSDHHRESGDLPQAIQAVHRAQTEGADPLRCQSALAELNRESGEYDQALSHLQEVARLSLERGDEEGLRAARRRMLEVDPGQLGTAEQQAKDLMAHDAQEMATAVLRRAIRSDQPKGDFNQMIACRELLSQLTNDFENTSWLSRAYHQRSDQVEGVERLWSIADRQEETGDLEGLCSTLRRLLDLDPNQVRAWRRLARAQGEQDLVGRALTSWHRAVDTAIRVGDFARGQKLVEEGLALSPFDVKLLLASVRCLNRLGERERAITACRSAARLARIAGDQQIAEQCLSQLIGLRPDDIALHIEYVEVLDADAGSGGERLIEALRHAIDVAARQSDFGVAIGWSERLLELLPINAWHERESYLELLYLSGHDVQTLQRGRETVVDMMAEDETRRAVDLLDKLIEHYPGETILAMYHARLCAQRNRKEAFLISLRRAVALLQQGDEVNRAFAFIDEMRPHYLEENIFDELEEALRQGQVVE